MLLRLMVVLSLVVLWAVPGPVRADLSDPFFSGPASADVSNPFSTGRVDATIVSELASAAPGEPLWLALRFHIDPGWHTYWLNPGDSGEPTRIRWTLPDGVVASDIHWPYPHRIPYGPLVNFGYEGDVTHLVRVDVPETWPSGRPIDIGAHATWLVCADICIPEEQRFSFSIPTEDTAVLDAAVADVFGNARMVLPVENPWPSRFTRDAGAVRLAVDVGAAAERVTAAVFFPAAWGVVEPAGEQQLKIEQGTVSLTMAAGQAAPDPALNGVLVLSELTDDGEVHRALTVAALADGAASALPGPSGTAAAGALGTADGAVTMGDADAGLGLFEALALALLGGVILNLMPCVFPVLSIKALALVRHAGDGGHRAWAGGLAYTGGVLAFMAGLAGLLIALRSAGAEIGWGFQLQSPIFVAFMALVLFGLGLALSGFIQVGGSMSGIGSGLAARGGLAGDAATGALAALVATPCTAPFMGVAIGFALTQPPIMAIAVFLALGLGLALPYLLLSLSPGLGRWLPKPGAWMERLKQALAFPLYASAAWLVWVLSIQGGPSAVLAVLIAMVLMGFAGWLYGTAATLTSSSWRIAGRAGTAAAVVMALAVTTTTATTPGPESRGVAARDDAAAGTAVGSIVPFTPDRLTALRDDGRAVFVNMTAAWCITCKVNEQVALKADRVAAAFAAGKVVWLEGDWTNRDPVITRYLESFGRSGVPLYVLYPAGGGEPVVLPQILTEEGMIAALTSAAGPVAASGGMESQRSLAAR